MKTKIFAAALAAMTIAPAFAGSTPVIHPGTVCYGDAKLRAAYERLGRSCANVKKINELERIVEALYPAGSDSAGVCGRNPGVQYGILKTTGHSSCRNVTPVDLLEIAELYVEGTSHAPVKSLRKLTYNDMMGIKNVQTVIFEYTYLDTVEPGAFRDQKKMTTLELSHSRFNNLDADTFCREGQWSLPSLVNLDMDTNRPAKGGTLNLGLFRCLANLKSVDIDTTNLSRIPRGMFAFNKKLESIDAKDNPLPESELRALRAVNGGIGVESGRSGTDGWDPWQVPDVVN